jgi:CRISPR-associated protein Cas2
MYVLMTYDVRAKRTELFRKILTRYLVHEQNSVFAGDLPESKLLKLRKELSAVAEAEDRLIEITAANRHNVSVSILRKKESNGAFILVRHEHHKEDAAIL